MKHTPAPWTIRNSGTAIETLNGGIIAETTRDQLGKLNASFIINAVNNHNEIVAALKLATLVMAKGEGLSYRDRREAHEACIAALEKLS